MKIYSRFALMVCLLWWGSACGGGAEVTQPSVQTTDSGVYPMPTSGGAIPAAPAYPGIGDTTVLATSGPIPEPLPGKAVITGRLLLNGEPVVNFTIYLADVQEQGGFAIGSYSRETSPRAMTAVDGRFVFSSVEPGKYGFILDNFVTYVALHIPGEAEDKGLMVEAVAGQLVDLGDLNYQELPEP